MAEIDLNEGLDVLRQVGMTVLSADKASDIDSWPSLDSLFGVREPRGLIHLVVSPRRLTREGLHELAQREHWEIPELTMEYPEKLMLRGQIADVVDNWILQCKLGSRKTIITDSDFILNELRIAIKEGRLSAQELRLSMVALSNGSYNLYSIDINTDGSFGVYPAYFFDFHINQLRRLP